MTERTARAPYSAGYINSLLGKINKNDCSRLLSVACCPPAPPVQWMNGACQLLAKHAFDCQQKLQTNIVVSQKHREREPDKKKAKMEPVFHQRACITSSSAQTKAGPKPPTKDPTRTQLHAAVLSFTWLVWFGDERPVLGKPFRMSLVSLSLCHATAKWQTVRGLWCKLKANRKNKLKPSSRKSGLNCTQDCKYLNCLRS